ncbi:MAG: hypothetical protein HQ559_16970 [Lentisphaerae bacterium]|nr:hypothetical protein [Lentisphaerota bacterium]
MKVAEAYEATSPESEQRMAAIGDFLLSKLPEQSLLFVHNDVLETILVLREQEFGGTNAVVIMNSSRILDQAYMALVQQRYQTDLPVNAQAITRRVMEVARRAKEDGQSEYEGVQLINNSVALRSPETIDLVSTLAMIEIAHSLHRRPTFFIPASRSSRIPSRWARFQTYGVFLTITPSQLTAPPPEVEKEWQSLLNAALPVGAEVHPEMINSLQDCISAASRIQRERQDFGTGDRLERIWLRRLKEVKPQGKAWR